MTISGECVRVREKRVQLWSGFFKKYEVRGILNTADCPYTEVSYKHFFKPKLKRRKRNRNNNDKVRGSTIHNINNISNFNETDKDILGGIDVCDIIDEDADEKLLKNIRKPKIIVDNGLQNWGTDEVFDEQTEKMTPNHIKSKEIDNYVHKTNIRGRRIINSLEDLIHFIEVDLKSNLEMMLIYRSESKILEADDYDYWHECTKEEMSRLQKYITRTELKECMKYYNRETDIHTLNDIIANQKKSNLKELLFKREFARSNDVKYLKYCQKICDEWQKLLKDLSVHWLVFYASGIIKSIEAKKLRMLSSPQHEGSINCRLNSRGISLASDVPSTSLALK